MSNHITREPEQVKAFRDTWRDGIHSYLTYLRDRLTVARDLLTDSGSIFVQIGDENVHRIRALMDEVFGAENFCQLDRCSEDKRSWQAVSSTTLTDFILWYAKNDKSQSKYRQPLQESRTDGRRFRSIVRLLTRTVLFGPLTPSRANINAGRVPGIGSSFQQETTDVPD